MSRQAGALNFIARRSGPFDGHARLDRKRVYILPTGAGLIFALLLLLLLIGSINYEKSLGYALTFLLAALAQVSMLATWRNLAGLEIHAGAAPPVFAGEQARFSLRLENPVQTPRHALVLSHHDQEQDVADIAAHSSKIMHFCLPAEKRGLLKAGRFRLATEFPGGLFVAWTWLDLSQQCLVYPAPLFEQARRNLSFDEDGEDETGADGLEHFSHLARYQGGDPISRISWKAAARSGELFSKKFCGGRPETTWIDWHDIRAGDVEQRLSIMAARIIEAEQHQQIYGLRLPDSQLPPDHGRQHFHRCMTQLALF